MDPVPHKHFQQTSRILFKKLNGTKRENEKEYFKESNNVNDSS